MITARQAIEIQRSPEAVFDFMLDFSQAPKWRYLVSSMETSDGLPPVSGSRVRLHFWVDGRERTQETTLAVSERPRHQRFVNSSEEGFHLQLDYELEPVQSGTRVRVTADTRGTSLATRLLLPLLIRGHRARFRDTLARLKEVVEAT